MDSKLIYDNAFFCGFARVICKFFLKLVGWRVVGQIPEENKYVGIAVPHTSNWDFPFFLSLAMHFKMRVRFLGKASLFRGKTGRLFKYLGGIPVNRKSPNVSDVVDQVVKKFNQMDSLQLGIAPEGTRSKVETWKTGFYRIAVDANVPILLAYLDKSKKEIGFGPLFYPTGDMDADIKEIQSFYVGKVGLKPR